MKIEFLENIWKAEPTDLPNGNANADNGNPAGAGEQEESEGNVQ